MKKIIFTSCAFLLLTSCKTIDLNTDSYQDYGHSSYSDQSYINQQQRIESDWRRRDIESKRRIYELEQKLRREKSENEIRRIQDQISRQRQEEAKAAQQYEQSVLRIRQRLENQRRQQEEQQRAQIARPIAPIAAPNLAVQAQAREAERLRREDAIRAQENRDMQHAIHNSLVTANQEERRRQAQQANAPVHLNPAAVAAPLAPAPVVVPVPHQAAQPQGNAEDAIKAQENHDMQHAIDNSLITADQEEQARQQEQQANAAAHLNPAPVVAPLAPAPVVVPAPVAVPLTPPPAVVPAPNQAVQPQENAEDVDGRSWYEAGEIVREYRQTHGGTPPTVAYVVTELQRRLNITAAQAQHVCDEMGLGG